MKRTKFKSCMFSAKNVVAEDNEYSCLSIYYSFPNTSYKKYSKTIIENCYKSFIRVHLNRKNGYLNYKKLNIKSDNDLKWFRILLLTMFEQEMLHSKKYKEV